jgi:glycosyltransferase involved in cell wall biosynthesis
VKALVVSEFYPRRADPVLGVWAHRQALATARAGAEVEVVVLHRLVPPSRSLRSGLPATARALAGLLSQPLHEERDGLSVTYVPFLSPPRADFYPYWGAWAAPSLRLALRLVRASFDFDVVHAHNAVPAADAIHRACPETPMVVSVHGGDVLYTAPRSLAGTRAVSRSLRQAAIVLANSRGTAELAGRYGAADVEVVHLGADPPDPSGDPRRSDSQPAGSAPDTLVTVGHLVARKRHADVVRALWLLRERHPELRYLVIGDGPERARIKHLADSLGLAGRVQMTGQLAPAEAAARAQSATIFVMPSTEEAFGVAYVEAMAAGIPVIGTRGEPGPEEIASTGEGIELVNPGDVTDLAECIDRLLTDRSRLASLGEHARLTARDGYSWGTCGKRTYAAYERALA